MPFHKKYAYIRPRVGFGLDATFIQVTASRSHTSLMTSCRVHTVRNRVFNTRDQFKLKLYSNPLAYVCLYRWWLKNIARPYRRSAPTRWPNRSPCPSPCTTITTSVSVKCVRRIYYYYYYFIVVSPNGVKRSWDDNVHDEQIIKYYLIWYVLTRRDDISLQEYTKPRSYRHNTHLCLLFPLFPSCVQSSYGPSP